MHKAIAKQLDLDERQTKQLELDLEQASWLYSSSIWKRMAAVIGYWFISYLMFAMVLAGILTAIPSIIVALQ